MRLLRNNFSVITFLCVGKYFAPTHSHSVIRRHDHHTLPPMVLVFFNLLLADTSRKQTAMPGPKGVYLREVWLYCNKVVVVWLPRPLPSGENREGMGWGGCAQGTKKRVGSSIPKVEETRRNLFATLHNIFCDIKREKAREGESVRNNHESGVMGKSSLTCKENIKYLFEIIDIGIQWFLELSETIILNLSTAVQIVSHVPIEIEISSAQNNNNFPQNDNRQGIIDYSRR